MINSRKKGFTLVELVIVIAVVAVLAAVLIPTFSNLVKKANMSADQQAVRQINTLLATEFATEKPEEIRDVIDMLEENGYNTKALKPLTSGYSFVWNKTDNKIEYVLESEINEGLIDLNEGLKYINVEISTAENFREALINGSDVTLSKDITIDGEGGFTINSNEDVTVNLGGHTLTILNTAGTQSTYAFDVYGKLKLENGIVFARGVQARSGGKLIIESGVTINAIDNNGGAAVYCWKDGEVIINGGEFNAVNVTANGSNGAVALMNAGGTVVVNGGEFNALSTSAYAVVTTDGSTTFNKAIITSNCGGICNRGGNTVIDSKVTVTLTDAIYYCVYTSGGTVTDKGANLNGGKYTYLSSANEGAQNGIIILPDNTKIEPGQNK